jgi:hypothetical protein
MQMEGTARVFLNITVGAIAAVSLAAGATPEPTNSSLPPTEDSVPTNVSAVATAAPGNPPREPRAVETRSAETRITEAVPTNASAQNPSSAVAPKAQSPSKQPTLAWVPGSSVKLEQLLGDWGLFHLRARALGPVEQIATHIQCQTRSRVWGIYS